ncbi:MAG: sigma-70 family RNA polymerase sigma factor [Proteobacteria bacterium]|nr:sigma-70 family RNA polymerase sigma factor [Pseudomonadota bacterium]
MDIRKQTDENLMLLYQNGDEAAFNELYTRYKGKVYGYLICRLNNNAVADEVYQNIFLKLHRTRSLYNPKYLFPKWLFTIVTTMLIDTYRSMGRNKMEELPENISMGCEIAETPDIDAKLNKLSDDEAAIIKLRYYDDKSFEDIAKILNTSQVNVRQKVSRAVRSLKKIFSKGGKNE